MALIQLNDLSIGFRGPPLLDSVNCQIEEGQRIGLLGLNGSGKTTLLRILAGDTAPDAGSVFLSPGKTVSLLPQDVPQDLRGTVGEVIRSGLPPEALDESHAWEADRQVERLLSAMNLVAEWPVESLSSGMKRRVLLARTLVSEPDLLLLDEPTNHLDIDAIAWLEGFLKSWPATLLFVTHDRKFLTNLATRILEIDRGRLFDWSCDYETFLVRKEAALATEDKQNALFDKRLAQEEAWIRQGIKARRTRNEGRVRALEKMRRERSERRAKSGTAKVQIQSAERSGVLVAEVEEISFAYDELKIVSGFSTSIMRGDKIGFIGPNGAGKTTLLKLLLGKLVPQVGTVRLGTRLQVAYFDQLRQQLDEEKTVQENVGEGSDSIEINGKSRHVLSYLQDFLFAPDRARTQVKFLSGGERNRILLAKLFSKPANVLVMDEPTNDLDVETLELLEERLIEFPGTLLVVSHDRTFLNNVVTSCIVFEPEGAREYVGGYDDWLRQRSQRAGEERSNQSAPANGKSGGANKARSTMAAPTQSKRLAYHEKRELAALPEKIEKLDAAIAALHTEMAATDFYRQPDDIIAAKNAELKALSEELAKAYERWEALESVSE